MRVDALWQPLTIFIEADYKRRLQLERIGVVLCWYFPDKRLKKADREWGCQFFAIICGRIDGPKEVEKAHTGLVNIHYLGQFEYYFQNVRIK